MTTFVFPDNTVLINFTVLGRHDIVEWFTLGQGRWTESVWQECGRSARYEGLAEMKSWGSIFGEPLRPTPAELINAANIADGMRKPGERSNHRKHMGEAETIAIIESRFSNIEGHAGRSIFLTDDHDAEDRAARRGIKVFTTADILAFAEIKGRITHAQARQYLAALLNDGHGVGRKAKDYDALVNDYRKRWQGGS
ncbi:hypothetical protein O6R08_08770 [Cutibacterium equinum]|uniref:PIN domain-containing protein n=1 Tax=Cutibacterium equinum TaxID=3016342 RepID=A0ABY7QX11_9ACTN|nr:hypothetical protein [Cutibacterium equinum]WCC79588.1 hypothetical protein O6R08_08770 [Cutibacterium equinum]